MRNHFDKQLRVLDNELITMGALCEEAIENAIKYLTVNESTLLQTVHAIDDQIDQKERDIENLCMKLLLMQQPVAKDLRKISSALKMISDMERIGDQASDIAEIASFVNQSGYTGSVHIEDMAEATMSMLTNSIDSFVRIDGALAKKVIDQDNTVDQLFEKVKRELIENVRNASDGAEALIDLLMIAKYLERIGDHAENIAGWVLYFITGDHESVPN